MHALGAVTAETSFQHLENAQKGARIAQKSTYGSIKQYMSHALINPMEVRKPANSIVAVGVMGAMVSEETKSISAG